MQVSNPNNIKIYNLSAGKSLPEVSTIINRLKINKVRGQDDEVCRT